MAEHFCHFCGGRASLFVLTDDFKVEICENEGGNLQTENVAILPLQFYEGINNNADVQLFKEARNVLSAANESVQSKYQEVIRLITSAQGYPKLLGSKKKNDIEIQTTIQILQSCYETTINCSPETDISYHVYLEIKTQDAEFPLRYQIYTKALAHMDLFLAILNTCTNKENWLQIIAKDLLWLCEWMKKVVTLKEKTTELASFEIDWIQLYAAIQTEVQEDDLRTKLLQTMAPKLQGLVQLSKQKAFMTIAQTRLEADFPTVQQTFNTALHILDLLGNRTELVDALNYLAERYMKSGHTEECKATYERTIQICRENHIENEQFATACNQIANMNYRKKLYRSALSCYKEAFAVYEKSDFQGIGRGNTMENIGILLMELGELTEAEGFYRETLAFRRRIGDKQWVNTCLRLGSLYQVQGKCTDAEQYYDLARKSIPANSTLAVTLYNSLGMLYDQLGRDREAELVYKRAINLLETQNVSIQMRATVFYNYAKLCFALQRFVEAKLNFEHSLTLQSEETWSEKERKAETLQSLGDTHFALNESEEAINSYNKAKAVLETLSPPPYSLIEVYESLGALTTENHYYETAYLKLPEIIKSEKLIPSCKFLGDYFISLNDKAKAKFCYETAVTIGQTNSGKVEVLIALLALYLEIGDWDSAKSTAVKAFPWIIDRQEASIISAVLGNLYLHTGFVTDAESWYSQSILLLPEGAESNKLRLYIINQLLNLGLYEGAVQVLLSVFKKPQEMIKICVLTYDNLLHTSTSRSQLAEFVYVVTKQVTGQENKTAFVQQCLKQEKDQDATFHMCIQLIMKQLKEATMLEAQLTILEMLNLVKTPITKPASEEEKNIRTCFRLVLDREVMLGFNSVLSLFLLLCKKCPTALIHSKPYHTFIATLTAKQSPEIYTMIRRETLDLKGIGIAFKKGGDNEAAIALFELVVELLKLLPPNKPIALSVNEIGDLLNEMNQFQKGKETYDESISILEKSSDSFQ